MSLRAGSRIFCYADVVTYYRPRLQLSRAIKFLPKNLTRCIVRHFCRYESFRALRYVSEELDSHGLFTRFGQSS